MSTPPPGRIARLAGHLAARGIDAGELLELQDELDAVKHPPGWFRRMRAGLMEFANRQWRHLWGELQESAELAGILRRAVAGEAISPVERDKVRAQVLDLLRVAPAGLVSLAVEAIPVPGTSVVTPWILVKLGLMPSRWREAHLLEGLKHEAARLRVQHHVAEADELDALRVTITRECEERERMAHEAALLGWWDADGDGEWDPPERVAYDAAVETLRVAAAEGGHSRRWFLCDRKHVFGPLRLAELRGVEIEGHLMVRLEGVRGWVCLGDVLTAGPA
jgi:hypothetical protein